MEVAVKLSSLFASRIQWRHHTLECILQSWQHLSDSAKCGQRRNQENELFCDHWDTAEICGVLLLEVQKLICRGRKFLKSTNWRYWYRVINCAVEWLKRLMKTTWPSHCSSNSWTGPSSYPCRLFVFHPPIVCNRFIPFMGSCFFFFFFFFAGANPSCL